MEEMLKKGNLLFFGGKGGTGKTTTSAATAMHAAKKGLKTLIISVDDKEHSLGNSFDMDIAAGVQSANDVENLYVYEMSATKLFDKWAEENKDVRDALSMIFGEDDKTYIAGSSEILGLAEIYKLAKSDEYDLVVVDTAPTASALGLLETVRGMETLMENDKFWRGIDMAVTWVKRGKNIYGGYQKVKNIFTFGKDDKEKELDQWEQLAGKKINDTISNLDVDDVKNYMEEFRTQVTSVREMLEDQDHTRFNIVGNPEQMSINESISLYTRLHDINMPVEYMVFNRVTEEDQELSEYISSYTAEGTPDKFANYLEYFDNQAKTQKGHMNFFTDLINGDGSPDTKGSSYLDEIVREFHENFEKLEAKGKTKTKIKTVKVKRFWEDVHGKEALEKVEDYLFDENYHVK